MGLFGNIFGENKLVGTVKIKFYGEDEASAEYETDVSDQEQKEMDMIQVFALYYAKMLYNLNRGEHSDALIGYVQKAVSEILPENGLKRPSILSSGQKLVEAKESGVTKTYSGELIEKSNKTRIIQTHMDMVGEGYYAPISTVMFLQSLIKNLSDGSLFFLTLSLGGMNKYYREQGDYADMKSLIAAPNFGFSLASKILSGGGK
jgi:hypothetical protein